MIILQNKTKERYTKMFKKAGIVTALSTALLFGGAFHTSVDASASTGQSQSQPYKVYYSIDGNWNKDFNCFDYLNFNWNNQQFQQSEQENTNEVKPKQETEQPKQEEPKQESEQEPQKDQADSQQEQPKQEAEAPVQQTEQKQEEQTQSESQQLNAFEQEVVELTNKEREKQGLNPLKVDDELSKVAREKSRDIKANNYFSHDSPTYGSPFDMMEQYGISYRTAGENIAKGQRTPEEVVNGWMNSDGHRANILSGDFTHIGVGYVEQGNHWTQQFIGK